MSIPTLRTFRPALAARGEDAPRCVTGYRPALLGAMLLLGCGASAEGPTGVELGKPPPPAAAETGAPAIAQIEGAHVSGAIAGLGVQVVSTYAYRDWMPRMGGPKGEDGGSPLHIAIGLVLTNEGPSVIALDRSARLGATGTPLSPVELDDLAGPVAWPLRIDPGQTRRLQLGTRDGPYFPLGEALDLEIDLTNDAGSGRVRIDVDDLPIGRTD